MPEIYHYKGGRLKDVWEDASSDLVKAVCSQSWVEKNFGKDSSFVFGGDSNGEVKTTSKFNKLREVTPHMFNISQSDDGTYTIHNVPIFKTHGGTRRNGHVSDRKFLDRMVKNYFLTKEATNNLFGEDHFAWLPKFHIGHTPNDSNLPEMDAVGYISNPYRVEDFLFSDLIGLSKESLDRFLSGRNPDRSAEVDIKRGRLLSVAALGFRTPHFGLPQMRSDVLKKKWDDFISKHDNANSSVKSFLFTREDLPMATKRTKKVSKVKFDPEISTRFFLALEQDDDLKAEFESQKDERIQKYMGMNGGQPPMGGDLMSIIQQVIQSMMSQKMNTDCNNPMMNASDAIDFESSEHHESDQGFEEEGTSVKGATSDGLEKGKGSAKTSVKKDGTPTTSEEGGDDDDETIDSEGKLVSKNIANIQRNIHSAMKTVPKESKNGLEEVFEEVVSTMKAMAELVDRQHHSIKTLQEDNSKQIYARRREAILHRLTSMFEQGNPMVRNNSQIQEHMKFALSLSDEQSETYLKHMESALINSSATKRISKNQAVTKTDNSLESSYDEDELNHLRKLGYSDSILRCAAAIDDSEMQRG